MEAKKDPQPPTDLKKDSKEDHKEELKEGHKEEKKSDSLPPITKEKFHEPPVEQPPATYLPPIKTAEKSGSKQDLKEESHQVEKSATSKDHHPPVQKSSSKQDVQESTPSSGDKVEPQVAKSPSSTSKSGASKDASAEVASTQGDRPVPVKTTSEEEQEKAAVKIQSSFRGHKVRKGMKDSQQQPQPVTA
jgi:hypothetical protein